MKIIPLMLLAIFLAGCAPATASPAPVVAATLIPMPVPTKVKEIVTLLPATAAATGTTASTPVLESMESATATTHPTTTITSTPLPTENVVENLLDWQPVPNQGIDIRSLAFDGEWLVVEDLKNLAGNRTSLFARKMDSQFQEIFVFQEWEGVQMNEWGSGIELTGGRVAFVAAPYMGDTTHGYEVWLADLERGEKVQVKASENALPGIAMNERWLAIKDSTSEMSDTGENCIELYALPGLTSGQTFCTEDRIGWLALSGDWLTYKRTARGENCPAIEALNLTTGETRAINPATCPMGIRIYANESFVSWWEDKQMVVWSQADGEKFRLPTERIQLCGERAYYVATLPQWSELRSWQPNEIPRVLHRFRGPEQYGTDDLPYYDIWDIYCGGGWVMFKTNQGDLFLAKDVD